ncbi:MAG TPA: hypothetical protein PK304_01745 [Mobilitalea sp.]|nr:hypothetical protein [Mobilitalea sp.]
MFKWDRLLRRKRENKNIYLKNYDEDLHDFDLQQESDDKADQADKNGDYEVVEIEILPAKIICPDCGGITLEGLDFCDKCGGEL